MTLIFIVGLCKYSQLIVGQSPMSPDVRGSGVSVCVTATERGCSHVRTNISPKTRASHQPLSSEIIVSLSGNCACLSWHDEARHSNVMIYTILPRHTEMRSIISEMQNSIADFLHTDINVSFSCFISV